MAEPQTADRSRTPVRVPAPIAEGLIPAAVEALLLSSDRPLSAGRIAAALGIAEAEGSSARVRGVVDALNESYEAGGRSFRIEQVAGGYRAVACEELSAVLEALHGVRESQSLSRAAVETLSIIAYRQPITRADLESIRGVACGEVLRSLLEKKLIDIAGRAEELGRPMLYGTTRRFLDAFGLSSIKDLPDHKDFAPAMSGAASARPAPGSAG